MPKKLDFGLHKVPTKMQTIIECDIQFAVFKNNLSKKKLFINLKKLKKNRESRKLYFRVGKKTK